MTRNLNKFKFNNTKFNIVKFIQIIAVFFFHSNDSPILGGLVLIIPAKMVAGGMAGLCAQTFTYPFDVTRRRMQLAYLSPKTHHYGWVFFLLYLSPILFDLTRRRMQLAYLSPKTHHYGWAFLFLYPSFSLFFFFFIILFLYPSFSLSFFFVLLFRCPSFS